MHSYKVQGWAPPQVRAMPLRLEEMESEMESGGGGHTAQKQAQEVYPMSQTRLHIQLIPFSSPVTLTLSPTPHLNGWHPSVAGTGNPEVGLYSSPLLTSYWNESPSPHAVPMNSSCFYPFLSTPCPCSHKEFTTFVCAALIMGLLSPCCISLCPNFHTLGTVIFPK